MQETDIAWCDVTWNPTHGCSKVSSGCRNCYASKISRQYGHTEKPWTNEHAQENVTEHPEKLEEPYNPPVDVSPEQWAENIDATAQPVRVFVNSMSDLFHSAVSESFVQDVFAVMRNCPEHVFQVLTKRPGRAADMTLQWPDNVWLGTSVEDDRVTDRIAMLEDADAATRFVSFEPLIGPVGDVDLSGVDWAIVGGESAPDDDRREMEHEWARSLLAQCRRDDVAFFFKQSSARYPETGTRLTVENEERGTFEQRRIREYPPVAQSTKRAREAQVA